MVSQEQDRADWVSQRQGRILLLPPGVKVMDPFGRDGVWDIIHSSVGTKTVPAWNTTPWPILTKTGLAITIYDSGKVAFNMGTSSA